MASHRDLIIEQFTKQAIPFSSAPAIKDEEALGLVVEAIHSRVHSCMRAASMSHIA